MNDRQEKIYNLINRRGSVSISLLRKEIYASEATLRRDLRQMEQDGLLIRTWGGAMATGGINSDLPPFVRTNANPREKGRIAQKASTLLRDNMTVFLASSTTVTHLARELHRFQNLTVITNGLETATALKGHPSTNIILLGGELYENYDLVGPVTESTLRQFNADICFFSCSGITAEGFTSIDINRLNVFKQMREHSNQAILLADSSKVGKKYTYNGIPFEELDYVVMEAIPKDAALQKALGKKLLTPK